MAGSNGMASQFVKPALYGLANVAAASGIVFANKAVLTTFGFHFIFALTLIHTLTTLVGMRIFCCMGVFELKKLSALALLPLAGAYVGYVVLNNLNLRINTVGFYQISKIAVAPTVLVAEAIFFGKRASKQVVAAIVLVCLGVGLSTVTDEQVGSNMVGLGVGAGAVVSTAAYQIWAGSFQKQLGANSFQLLHQYSPLAAGLLGGLVPLLEPVGIRDPTPDTLLGFPYSPLSLLVIAVSALLGLAVSLSTFLVIGATSSLTYNLVGHSKTIIILLGGCIFFGDEMPLKKLAGINVAMVGIIYYTKLKLTESSQPLPLTAKSPSGAEEGQSDGDERQPLRSALKTRSFSRDLTMATDLAFEDLNIATPSLPKGLPSPGRPPRR